MNHSIKVGLSFGLTSGIITTLGLLVGLSASTESKLVVIGGILTIAIADAMSDALGIHVSEESEGHHTLKEIWMATLSTFLAKFIFSLTFLIPVLLFDLQTATIISSIYGLVLLGSFSYYLAKRQNGRVFHTIFEHLIIAILVIVITYFVGHFIRQYFY